MSERGFAVLTDADIQKQVLRQRLVNTLRHLKILKIVKKIVFCSSSE